MTNRRCLVTGGAGFVGSHLCEALLKRGAVVTAIDDLSTGRFENIRHLVERSRGTADPQFSLVIDTVTNPMVLDRLASQCDVVFHLAAAVGVKLIVDNPVHTIETNIMGTEAVLKAAARYRAKVVIASTSEVYGKGNSVPFQEEDDVVLGPTCRSRWAYAASKMVDEFLALAYHREKRLEATIFRLFNTVGPRQIGRYGMVVPRFIRQAMEGGPLSVYGDGKQSRCFLHVADAVEAIVALAECRDAVGGVCNIGSTEEVSVYELARRVLELVAEANPLRLRDQIELVPYEKAYASGFEDMRRRVPDIGKIRRLTGWEPRRRLTDIIRETHQFMKRQGELES